jgi:hypothetical protein
MLKSLSKAIVLVSLMASPATGQVFENGLDAYNRGDYAAALNALQPLALGGERRAQHYLAFMYLRGKGVRQSDFEAVKWLRRSAEQGHVKAQYNLAVMYHIGLGARQNDAEAVKWFKAAAKQGHSEAEQNLLFMRTKGRRVLNNDALPSANSDLRGQINAIKPNPILRPRTAAAAPSARPNNVLRRQLNAAKVKPKLKAPPITKTAPVALVRKVQRKKPIAVKTVPLKSRSVASTKTAQAIGKNKFHVQLGAVKLKARAVKEAKRLNLTHKLILGNLKIVPIHSDLGKRGIFYRLRAGPLNNWESANTLCRKLSARKQRCIVAKP